MKMRVLSVVLVAATIFTSCKKNAADDASPLSNDASTQKAQAWFEKEVSKQSVTGRVSATELKFGNVKPQWNQARHFNDDHQVIVPAEMNKSKNAALKTVSRFLVMEENASGDISNGYYLYVLGTGNNAPEIDPALLSGKRSPEHFTGALVRYGVDGHFISSSHYDDGKISAKQDKIVTKEGTPDPTQNIVPLDEGCSYVNIDWYWQTYVNGVLVYEEYLFSSTEIICEGGGGGSSQGATCAQQANDFLNAGHAVSILQSMETDMDADSLRCTIRPNWKIFSAGTWFIYSYETIVWARTSRSQAFNFSSYITRGDAALGTSVGGTRSYTIISKTPIPVGPAGTSVIVEIDFTVKNQIVCNQVPIDPVILGAKSNMRFLPPITVRYEG